MVGGANCPQCGAAVEAAMPGLPVTTCSSCDAMLVISDGQISAVGDSGRVPFDVSPLQIGTTLQVGGARGEIVGRERWGWERGSWNEWLLYLPGGDLRWVAEESGLYMVMSPANPRSDVVNRLKEIDRRDHAALGMTVQHENTVYTVADIKTIRCIASEGHLPEVITANFPRESIDLRTGDGGAFTFQSDRNGGSCWVGRYYELAELQPGNLRAMEGWNRPRFEVSA